MECSWVQPRCEVWSLHYSQHQLREKKNFEGMAVRAPPPMESISNILKILRKSTVCFSTNEILCANLRIDQISAVNSPKIRTNRAQIYCLQQIFWTLGRRWYADINHYFGMALDLHATITTRLLTHQHTLSSSCIVDMLQKPTRTSGIIASFW